MQVIDEGRRRAIVEALSDEYCRKILASTSREGKTPEQVASEQNIPISTCYRRIHELIKESIIRISKIELAGGRKLVYYKSTYKFLELKFDSDKLQIEATLNVSTPEEHLAAMLGEMRSHASIVHDCDICQARAIPCRVTTVGESKSRMFVCSNCEAKVAKGEIPAGLRTNDIEKMFDDARHRQAVEITA
jgi:predicted transcriptional regulator